jgi:hypothetical protein
MGTSGLSPEMVRNALYDLEKLGVASNDMALTAFVHLGVERSSNKRLEEAAALEIDLIAALRETAPDLSKGESSFLHLRRMTQYLKDMGHVHALPEIIWRLVRGIAQDGRRDESGTSSLRLRRIDAETVEVHLQREWSALTRTAEIRRAAAKRLLDHLLQSVPVGSRGTDLLAETTLGKLLAAITGDLELKSSVKEPQKLLDRALLWLHEQDVIRLNKGLAVFRPAMTIRLDPDRRGFTKADFAPLKLHYDEQVVQIHVMAEYVQRGLQTMGDDDQNIYAFSGASVDFIRRFETDYAAKATFLIENYRSSAHIIEAANAVIAPAQNRMKTDNPIVIDRARKKDAPGGAWQKMDPVGRGRVQLLTSLGEGDLLSQAMVVMHELERLAALDPAWNWSRCAVISREWKILEPIRAYCETNGIPVQTADEEHVNVWRLRETQQLVAWVRTFDSKIIHAGTVKEWLGHRPAGTWWSLLVQAVDEYSLETANSELPAAHFVDWLAEWGREVRRRQTGLLLLTAHRSKGLEFDHVAVLDGGWSRNASVKSLDETRRLFYVAMTRARQTLTLVQMGARHTFSEELRASASVFHRPQGEPFAIAPELHMRYILPSMRDIDIGFAGRQVNDHPVHQHLSALVSGSPLQLLNDGQRWILLDQDGQTVGHMSRAFSPPSEMKCVSAHALAIQVRRLQDTDEDYQHLVKSDSWEVVLPELVFAPETSV